MASESEVLIPTVQDLPRDHDEDRIGLHALGIDPEGGEVSDSADPSQGNVTAPRGQSRLVHPGAGVDGGNVTRGPEIDEPVQPTPALERQAVTGAGE